MGHLNKKRKIILAVVVVFLLLAATIPAAIWVTRSQTAQLANDRDRCQTGQHAARHVAFESDQVVPASTNAKLCDSLTFTNRASQTILLAFGPHEHHISYDGISERLLEPGQNTTITLVKAGTYNFHDHIGDLLKGSFTVN